MPPKPLILLEYSPNPGLYIPRNTTSQTVAIHTHTELETPEAMASLWFAALVVLPSVMVTGALARPMYPSQERKQPMQTFRPYNIAHRGSNGELPEETAVAYMKAIEEGADFIESDIQATKDGHLVCFHDVTLDDTTDIAEHKEFRHRRRTLEVQWVNVTGFFVTDFTLAELKTLRAKQRWAFRDKSHNGISPIITFDEFIDIALNANRVVGIYPEIKSPVFANTHVKWADGKRMEDRFVETLKKYGYCGEYMSQAWRDRPIFIQSFAPTSLIYVSKHIDSPKVLLIDDVTIRTEDTNQTYYELTSDKYLDHIKKYVVGIGPWKDTLVPPTKDNRLGTPTDLVAMAHARNLQVHPYTYRNENQFLRFDFKQDPYKEYDYWLNVVRVDGLFTDFPGSLHRHQKWSSEKKN